MGQFLRFDWVRRRRTRIWQPTFRRLRLEQCEPRRLLESRGDGEQGDTLIQVVYDFETGEFGWEADRDIRHIQILSDSGIFVGEPTPGSHYPPFDVVSPTKIFRLGCFRDVSFGPLAEPFHSPEFMEADLSIQALFFDGVAPSFEIIVRNLTEPVDGPRVAGMSVQPDEIISQTEFDIEITFDEPIVIDGDATGLLKLADQDRPDRNATAWQVTLTPDSRTLTASFVDQSDGRYHLILSGSSDDASIRDTDGHLLDGEFTQQLPSGNGFAGGTFRYPIVVDVDETRYDGPMTPVPRVGLATFSSQPVSGYLTSGNVDEIVFPADAGDVVSFDLATDEDVRLVLQGPNGPLAPPVVGRDQYGPFSIDDTGEYRLAVGYAAETTPYDVTLWRGMTHEGERQPESNNNNATSAETISLTRHVPNLESATIRGWIHHALQDWYRLTMEDGQRLSVRLFHERTSMRLRYELLDDAGRLIHSSPSTTKAEGHAEANLLEYLDSSTDGEANEYYLRVHSDGSSGTYWLQAALDARLSPLPDRTSEQVTVYDLPAGIPLLAENASNQGYRFNVIQGDSVRVDFSRMPGQSQRSAITFTLTGTQGDVLTTAVLSEDQTTGHIQMTPADDGEWTINIDALVDSAVTLQRTGGVNRPTPINTLSSSLFTIDGKDGVLVEFDQPIDFSSVDVTDLTVNGVVAVDALLLDSRTVFFELSEFPQDPVQIQMQAGSVASLSTQLIPSFMLSSTRAKLGDVDRIDGVNAQDIDFLCSQIRDGIYSESSDLNDDGVINHDDYDLLIEEAFRTSTGDANLDRSFNSSDLVQVFVRGLYDSNVEEAGWADGDWTCDGRFDSSDFVKAFQAGTYEVPRASQSAAAALDRNAKGEDESRAQIRPVIRETTDRSERAPTDDVALSPYETLFPSTPFRRGLGHDRERDTSTESERRALPPLEGE